MRRGSDGSINSLELLLDTICNMFGGIVLIFILLVVLSQISSRESQVPVVSETPETGVTREVWERQERQIAELTREIEEWLAKVGQTNQVAGAPLPDIGLLEEQLQVGEEHVQDLQQQLTNWVMALAVITNQLQNSKMENTGVIAEVSDRTPVFCAIRYNRFYAIHNVSTAALPRRRSDRQVTYRDRPDGSSEILLKKEIGQILAAGCEHSGVFREVLANVRKESEYLQLVVYPDSYESFQYVLGVLKKNGMAYAWLPLPENEGMVMSTSAVREPTTIMK